MAFTLPQLAFDQSAPGYLRLPAPTIDQSERSIFALPAPVFNQSVPKFTLVPRPVIDQSISTNLKIPPPTFNNSVIEFTVTLYLPEPTFDQSLAPLLDIPIPVFDQSARPAYVGPELPAPLINQSVIGALKLPTPLVVVQTDTVVGVVPVIDVSITVEAPASIIAPLPPIQSALTATVSISASINARVPVVRATSIAGRNGIEASVPAPTANVSVIVPVIGIVNAAVPAVRSQIDALSDGIIAVHSQVPAPRPDLIAVAGIYAKVNVQVPAARARIVGMAGQAVVISAEVPAVRASSVAYYGIFARVDGEIPLFTQLIDAGLPAILAKQIVSLCMNTRTYGISEYENYEFNSFARFNGKTIGANKFGLFELDANPTDDGAEISSHWAFGAQDFGIPNQKVVEQVFVGGRTESALIVTASADEGDVITYEMDHDGSPALKQRRQKMAKGESGKYWSLGFSNQGGGDFEVDSIDVDVRPMRRGI